MTFTLEQNPEFLSFCSSNIVSLYVSYATFRLDHILCSYSIQGILVVWTEENSQPSRMIKFRHIVRICKKRGLFGLITDKRTLFNFEWRPKIKTEKDRTQDPVCVGEFCLHYYWNILDIDQKVLFWYSAATPRQYSAILCVVQCDRYAPLSEGTPVLDIGYSDPELAKMLLIFDDQAILYLQLNFPDDRAILKQYWSVIWVLCSRY